MVVNSQVSVVIVNYDGGEYTLRCIESILRCDKGGRILEIITLDNESTDGSPKALLKSFANEPKVKLIFLHQNLGFAKANNVGYKLSKGRYCVFLNQDTMVQEGWLEAALETFASDDRIVIVQPKILKMNTPQIIDSVGGFINRICIAYEKGSQEIDKGQFDREASDVFYAKGAAFILDRSRFPWKDMTLFDDAYLMYCEDVDLCWRLRLAGKKVVFCPRSKVFHMGGARIRGINPQQIFHQEKNRLLTLTKNYNLMNATISGSLLALSDTFLFLYFLGHREFLKARAVSSAILWNAQNIKVNLRKRALIQRNRSVSDTVILRNMVRFNLPELLKKMKNI